MSSFLKRELAPLTDAAWAFIDSEAKRRLAGNLSARTLVDFNGPKGLEYSAINLGRLQVSESPAAPGVRWGLREVLPLVEVRVPFEMNIWELDNISRGTADADAGPIQTAAQKAALFEETLIYYGFEASGADGMIKCAVNKPVEWDAENAVRTIESAVVGLQRCGIGGPYALVLGSQPYEQLMAAAGTDYPPLERVRMLTRGPVKWSPALKGGVLFSTRGGDFELTVGQDFSIGFSHADKQAAGLYIMESLTFRVLDPEAIVPIEAG